MKPNKNIYDFESIKSSVTVTRYLEDKGVAIKGGRFAAIWRNSKDNNCSVAPDGLSFFDHVEKRGGSVIDLCMLVEQISLPFLAAQTLGERYNIAPVTKTKVILPTDGQPVTRYMELLSEGWDLKATYTYTDKEGVELYSVLRMQRGGEKTFLQRTPSHWGLENVRRVLYNLPAVIKADTVYIVEGEKDADTLNKLGYCATTNNGGAKNWIADFNRFLQAKNVVILADNDEAGQEHARIIVREINDIVSSLKVVTPSSLPKGDVTDYFEIEKKTQKAFDKLVRETKCYDRKEVSAANAQYSIEQARLLNAEPFRNFRVETSLDKSGKEKETEVPLKIQEMCKECRERFLDFPRRMSNILFDRSIKTGEIRYFATVDALFAWIAMTSKQPVEWSKARGAISRAEFYQALLLSVQGYEGISRAPHYPLRPEIFYINRPLPQITSGESPTLDKLMSFFAPANEHYRILIKAFFMSPMFFGANSPRPAWVIDSVDGKGVGKTTLVKLLAETYEETPIDIDTAAIKNDISAIVKRLISSDGRSKRICLLDNVQGSFRSPNLARLITATSVSGIAPYGRGEESRMNDLTYIITSNAASLDDDLAQRTYTIKLKRSKRSVNWEQDVRKFISANREHLYAEIIDRLAHPKIEIATSHTRYPEFERTVLCAACESMDDYTNIINTIISDTDESNVSNDRAQEVEEVFRDAISSVLLGQVGANARPSWLNTAAVSHIISASETLRLEGIKKGEIEEMIQSSVLTAFARKIRAMRVNGRTVRGRLWLNGKEIAYGETHYINVIEVEKDNLVYRCAELHKFTEV